MAHPLRHSTSLKYLLPNRCSANSPPPNRALNMLRLLNGGTAYGELHAFQD